MPAATAANVPIAGIVKNSELRGAYRGVGPISVSLAFSRAMNSGDGSMDGRLWTSIRLRRTAVS
jgi:hypothetical protein